MSYLQDRLEAITQTQVRDVNYVEVTDDSNTAFHVLRILRVIRRRDVRGDVTTRFVNVLFRPLMDHHLTINSVDCSDLRAFDVALNFSNVRDRIYLPDCVRDDAVSKVAMTVHCVAKMLIKATQQDTWKRIIPQQLVQNVEQFQQFMNLITRFLRTPIRENHSYFRNYNSLNGFRFETYGQLIFAMFLVRYRRHGNFSRSIRLMLFYLFQIVTIRENVEIFNGFYEWIVSDDCQSCSERKLIERTMDYRGTDTLYEEGNLALNDQRKLWFEQVEAQYVIRPHAHHTPPNAYSIVRLEHSEYIIRNRSSTVTVRYRGRDNAPVSVKLNFHHGIALMRCLSIVMKGLKGMFFNQDNSFVARAMLEVDGGIEGTEVEELMKAIASLPLLSSFLRNLSANILVILFYIGIPSVMMPKMILNNQIDFFDATIAMLFSFNPSMFAISKMVGRDDLFQDLVLLINSPERKVVKRNIYATLPIN